MKKAILIISALVMVVSGVAAVSAYEAHTVNVTAHVENALDTPSDLIIGGSAAFPEEWLTGDITVTSSTSFKTQTPERRTEIDFKVCAQPKTVLVPIEGDAYIWAGGFTFVSTDYDTDPLNATWVWIGPARDEVDPVPSPFCPTPNVTGTVGVATDETLTVGMDMPVFTGYYIPETDVLDKPRPNGAVCGDAGIGDPCVVSAGNPQGDDYGLDLIIQVTDIR